MADEQPQEQGHKLFIGGLAWTTDEAGLQDAFGKYGQVLSARVIMDRQTNRSKGYGFVTFASREEAEQAVQGLNGQDLDGRTIRCDFAQEKESTYSIYFTVLCCWLVLIVLV
jgi:heterogeneous nuclear ribonucleoprotein A1/A3